jgi:aminoglycoside 2'-N-acetyltransferase I
MLTGHTADLDPHLLARARGLLYDVFGDEMTEADWEHALGGIHAVLLDGDDVIAHAAVVQRRLLHGGRALRCGYVEGVAVDARRRREGHAGAVMAEVERVIRGAYDLGALGATDEAIPLYESRGWKRWQGPTSALTPDGLRRTPDADGAVFVLPVSAELDLSGELTCDWRDGDVW